MVFATPNYSFQVSARLKNFLDRTAYIFHRPRFFGKAFCAIVTQGFFGGKQILKYLETMGENFGFTVSKGASLNTLDPITAAQQTRLAFEMAKASGRFWKAMNRKAIPKPSFFRLMMFRITRTMLKTFELRFRDYDYYREKGWFESDYYYATSLGPLKKTSGYVFDWIARRITKRL